MTDLTILFQFDRETLTLKPILYNGATDTEKAWLREIVDVMLKALRDRETEHLGEPES